MVRRLDRHIMLDDFLFRAFLGGAGFAALAGPLGSFVVWRRMAYFGETLAHATLLGVALSLAIGTNFYLGVLGVSIAAVLLLTAIQHRVRDLPMDTILGVLATGALASGVIVAARDPAMRVDLLAYLFGDILAVSGADLLWILPGALLAGVVLFLAWRDLLAVTVHEDLARVQGINVGRVNLLFLLMLAFVVAIAIKIVGLLLIVSLLIVPPASCRPWSRTPEAMALLSALVGVLSVGGGLALSMEFDFPAGPAIVVTALGFFAFSLAGRSVAAAVGRQR